MLLAMLLFVHLVSFSVSLNDSSRPYLYLLRSMPDIFRSLHVICSTWFQPRCLVKQLHILVSSSLLDISSCAGVGRLRGPNHFAPILPIRSIETTLGTEHLSQPMASLSISQSYLVQRMGLVNSTLHVRTCFIASDTTSTPDPGFAHIANIC